MAGTLSTTPELLQEGVGLLKQELLLGTEALQAAQEVAQGLGFNVTHQKIGDET